MGKRHSIGRAKSKSMFTRNALRVHPKNTSPSPMRGGIRL